uniref:Sodium channel protein Nachlike [Bombus impatiens] n=1 Tax=Lepeophtheirus salmonis TaxID=72036 RepID=A0A0K2V8R3_LEPSM
MKIGTLLSWLYNHVDDLNDDQFSFGMKEKILEVLKPSQIPEVSSRRRFETSEDIFLPDLAQSLIGKHSSESKKDLNIQGIKYTEDLYYMMKYSQSPMEVFQNSGKINPKPGIPFCLFANSNEKGKKIDEYPEKFCKSMQPVMNEDGICYSYNNVNFKLERESNYTDKLDNIQGVGHKKGLTLLVDSQMIKNRARKAVSDYEGFKVIVTVPGAIAAKVSFIVEPDFPGEHSFYLHGIHYITASPDVIDWNKDANVCYFPQTKELTYYKYYLQDNCLQECKLKKVCNERDNIID